jgi:hypothetical protein
MTDGPRTLAFYIVLPDSDQFDWQFSRRTFTTVDHRSTGDASHELEISDRIRSPDHRDADSDE